MFFLGKILLTNIFFFLSGKIFYRFIFKDKGGFHQSEIAVFGSIIISFFALLINFFFPLDKILNTIIFFIPVFFFLKYKLILKKDLLFIFYSSILIFLVIAYSNINTPDAGLYHLPYTQILNENKIILGLSNLHFRFGHVSIIQYLSAINYNHINGLEGILIPLASLMVYIFLYFINEIYQLKKSNFNITTNQLFCLCVVCYISYKINRYSGFGNDAIAHMLMFYLISIFFKSEFNYHYLQKTSIISLFIFLNKVTLLLAFLFPLIIFFKCKEKRLKIFFSFSVIFLILWLLKNILISSCLIFPIEKTCYNNFLWSNKIEINKQRISGEAWAKGWPNRKNESIDQKTFIKKYNWIDAWSSIHLKYILKIILPYVIFLLLISLIINLKFKKNQIKRTYFLNDRFKIISTMTILLLGNIIFFLKFPLYRYGYSYTISIISIFFSLSIFSFNKKFIKKIFYFILIISIIVFSLKQIVRIKNNYSKKSIWPNIENFIEKNNIKNDFYVKTIGENFNFYVSKSECMYINAPCTNNFNQKLSHKKVFDYDLIFVEK